MDRASCVALIVLGLDLAAFLTRTGLSVILRLVVVLLLALRQILLLIYEITIYDDTTATLWTLSACQLPTWLPPMALRIGHGGQRRCSQAQAGAWKGIYRIIHKSWGL